MKQSGFWHRIAPVRSCANTYTDTTPRHHVTAVGNNLAPTSTHLEQAFSAAIRMAEKGCTIRRLSANSGCCGARRAAAFLLVLGAFTSFSVHADEKTGTATPTTQFDGLWQTTLSCTNANGALGYSFRFLSTVKNGVLHAEKGTAHEAGWLQIDGSLRADGVADLYVEGLVGAAPFAVGQRPAGTPYRYHVAARFSLDRAEGHRVEGRPCTVVWTREQ